MPMFQIGLEDGRSLRIEADSQEAALTGAEHFVQQEAPSGVVAGAQQGLSNLLHGPAETAKQFLGADTSALEAKAQEVAPKDYKAAPIVPKNGKWFDPTTYTWKNVPQNLAENAPAIAESIIAAKLAGRAHPLAGLLAGAGVLAANSLGDTAKNAAAVRTGDETAEPSTQDKTRALATVALQSVPQAIGVSRFLPGASKVSSVGTKGVIESGTKALTTTAIEGASGAAQNAIGQAGLTVGTDKGLTVDGNEVANAGVSNAFVGGALTAPRAIANIKAAQKYKDFGGDNESATKSFANRISDAADGDSLRNTKTGFESVRSAHEDVRSELKVAAKALPGLDADTDAAIKRAGKGRKLSESDLQRIEDNATSDVADLARQAHVGALLKEQGDFQGGNFRGGVANTVGKHIRAYQNPIGAGVSAGLAIAGLGGHAASLFAYSPSTLAALATAYAGLRGLDALTGNRSPANNFVSRFADPTVATRQLAPAAAPQPAAPSVSPTGPSIPTPAAAPTPWGPTPAAAAPQPSLRATLNSNAALHSGIATIAKQLAAAKRQQLLQQAPPLLQQLAATRPAPAPVQTPVAPAAPPPAPSTSVDPKVLAQTRGLMTALARIQKIKDSTIGRQDADAVAQNSPLVSEAGGLDAISNPNVGKRASQLVSAANALRRLREQPEEAAAANDPTPNAPDAPPIAPVAKITKKNGKVEEAPQKEEGSPTYTGDYVPLTDAELYGKGWNDQRFAAFESNKPHVKMKEQYAENIEFDRKKRRNILAEIVGDHETDGDIGARLLEELHHTRRGDKAAKAIKHFAAQMSPENRAAVLKRMDSSFINSMWSK